MTLARRLFVLLGLMLVLLTSRVHAQPAGQADLRITNISVFREDGSAISGSNQACSGERIRVSYTIGNFVFGNAGPRTAQVSFSEVLVNGIQQASNDDLVTLNAGQSATFNAFVNLPVVGGTTSADVTVDFSGVGDATPFNEETEFVTVRRCLPDLTPFPFQNGADSGIVVFDGSEAHGPGNTFDEGTPIFFDAQWANLGEAATPAGFPLDVLLEGVSVINGPLVAPPLDENTFTGFANPVQLPPLPAGVYTLELVLDGTELVTEENENNNTASVVFTVMSSGQADLRPFAPAGIDAPIIISTDPVATSNSALTEGDTVFVIATYLNDGVAATGVFGVGFTLNGNAQTFAAGPLLPNEGERLAVNFGALPAGMYEIRVQLDATGLVSESDESNNEFVAVFTVAEAECLADVNDDGVLNGLDFGAWLGAFNAGALSADQNGDGIINGLDFGSWLANFNAGCD